MAKKRGNLILDGKLLTQVAGIMEIVLGAKETGSISSEIRNLMMRMRIGRSDILEEQLKNMREVLGTLISWAAAEGLGYTEATRLLSKLYSGCEEESVDQT